MITAGRQNVQLFVAIYVTVVYSVIFVEYMRQQIFKAMYLRAEENLSFLVLLVYIDIRMLQRFQWLTLSAFLYADCFMKIYTRCFMNISHQSSKEIKYVIVPYWSLVLYLF